MKYLRDHCEALIGPSSFSSAMADSTSGYPYRQYMDEPGIQWREGKPDYTKVNKAYLEGRTRTHKEGSLAKIVEDLVKTWEMEASHKTRIEVRYFLSCQVYCQPGYNVLSPLLQFMH